MNLNTNQFNQPKGNGQAKPSNKDILCDIMDLIIK